MCVATRPCFSLTRLRHGRLGPCELLKWLIRMDRSGGSSGHFRWIGYPLRGKEQLRSSFFHPHPAFISTLNFLFARAQKSVNNYLGHGNSLIWRTFFLFSVNPDLKCVGKARILQGWFIFREKNSFFSDFPKFVHNSTYFSRNPQSLLCRFHPQLTHFTELHMDYQDMEPKSFDFSRSRLHALEGIS